MQIVIQNADNALFELLTTLNKSLKRSYKIEKSDEIYTADFIKSVKNSQKELEKNLKDGTLKTFNSVDDMRAELGV